MNTIALIWGFLCHLCAGEAPPVEEKGEWHFSYSVLYWQGKEHGLEYTNQPSNIFVTDDFTQTSVISPSFQWEPGVRLGLGYTQSDCQWTYQAGWTYLQSKGYGQKNVSGWEGMFPLRSLSPDTLQSDYVTSAQSKWHLSTNLGDLLAQYNWDFAKPFAGVRFASLNQKFKAKYAGGTFYSGTDVNTFRCQYYGAGPRVGVNLDGCVGAGFSLFGRAAIAPLFGNFDIDETEKYLGASRFDLSKNTYHFLLSTDYELGFQWKGELIDVGAAWEWQEFFYANQWIGSKNQHLYLQGVTFNLGFTL